MKTRKLILLAAISLGITYALGLGGCVQQILFGVAPLLI